MPDKYLLYGAILGTVGCSASPLVSTHKMPISPHHSWLPIKRSTDNSKYPLGAKSPLVEKYCFKSQAPAQGPSALDLKIVLHTGARDFHSSLLLGMCGHKTHIKKV